MVGDDQPGSSASSTNYRSLAVFVSTSAPRRRSSRPERSIALNSRATAARRVLIRPPSSAWTGGGEMTALARYPAPASASARPDVVAMDDQDWNPG
jgi:hypothetical protein